MSKDNIFENRLQKLEELENEAKSWGAINIIPWRKDFLLGGGVTICFDNGYCADCALTNASYGHELNLFELAVIEYNNGKVGSIVYDTPITNDVLGHLDINECRDYCMQIKELPQRAR